MENISEFKDLSAKKIIEQYKITKKAEFLYKNGFITKEEQLEKLEETYKDVTYNNGFSGFNVYLNKENKIIIALAETEEENIYSYKVIELEDVTEEEYNELIKIKEITNKLSISKIFGICSLIFTVVSIICFIINMVTDILAGAEFSSIIFSTIYFLPAIATSIGVCALVFKK